MKSIFITLLILLSTVSNAADQALENMNKRIEAVPMGSAGTVDPSATPGDTSNNPTPTEVEGQAKALTGEEVLKKIHACRKETQEILKKVPYRISKNEQFVNILAQIKNDQEICLKYIETLDDSIRTLSDKDVGNLAEALLATKNRIASEKKMVELLSVKNPFNLERTDQEIKQAKMESIYMLNTYASMSKAQEEVSWEQYRFFAEKRALETQSEAKQTENSTGFSLFSVIIICFILFVVFKRSQWAKSTFGQVLKKVDDLTKENPSENKAEVKKEELPVEPKDDKK